MFRFTRSQPQPIGLDIGVDGVRMIQFEVITGGSASASPSLKVVAAARKEFPVELRDADGASDDERLNCARDLIGRMLSQHPFHGRAVVTSLPRNIVSFKNLRLPVMPAVELDAAIRFESRNIFSFDTEQARIDYLPAGEVRHGGDVRQEVIVIAAQNADVNGYIEKLHRCGVVIASLDVAPCALFRCVERFVRRREDEQEVQVLIDIGARTSQMIIGRGREISFYKSIEIGGRHFNDAVARKLGITFDEARALRRRFVETLDPATDGRERDAVRQAVYDATRSTIENLGREIAMCLRYHSVTFRGHRPARLRLVGGEAQDVQIQTLLAAAVNVPVEVGKPLYSVNTSAMSATDQKTPMSEWATAMGLGLKLTRQRFAPRDGKPRDPGAVTPAGSSVEVIDIDAAVASSGGVSAPVAPSAGRAVEEVARA